MKIIKYIIIVLITIIMFNCTCIKPILPEGYNEVAQQSLETLKQLVTDQNYKQMGFEKPEEVYDAKLGNYLNDYIVRLDYLKDYKQTDKPDTFLTSTNSIIFPVLINERVCTSITLVYNNKNWEASSYGYANLIKMTVTQQRKLSKDFNLTPDAFFRVRVPAFNIVFLGHRNKDQLFLTPLIDTPELKFIVDVPIPANEVFATLAPLAFQHDELPR